MLALLQLPKQLAPLLGKNHRRWRDSGGARGMTELSYHNFSFVLSEESTSLDSLGARTDTDYILIGWRFVVLVSGLFISIATAIHFAWELGAPRRRNRQ